MTLLKIIQANDFKPDAAPRPLDEATLEAAGGIVPVCVKADAMP